MSLSRNGLVLDAIEVFNLGRKTETEHVTSQNPFLRFAIGSQTYKTETKKHVGAHAVFQDSLRFNATPGDELQITAEHRRSILKHSKTLLGTARIPVADLGASNSVTLVNKHRTNVGVVKFAMKALVPLNSFSDLSDGKLVAEDKLPPETPSSVAAFSDKENSVRDNAELVEQPSSLDSPLLIQTEQHTTHTRKTTTTTIEDTALSLHVRAPFQDEEAHMLIEAGKQKLLEDRAKGRLTGSSGSQNETLLAAAGHLCKLFLAAYLGLLDVALVRVLEYLHKPQWAPRNLLGISHKPSHAHLDSISSAYSEPATPLDTPIAYLQSPDTTPAREDRSTPLAKISSSSSEAMRSSDLPPVPTRELTSGEMPSVPTHKVAPLHNDAAYRPGQALETQPASTAEKREGSRVPVLANEE